MVLFRDPSWRQGSRPQTVDLPQDFGERCFGDGHFGQLEGDVAAMSDNLGTDLDQLLAQRGQ